MKFVSYDIVFQEVPNQITLALNISNCPFRCSGCHSQHLWDNIGEELNETTLSTLIEQYNGAITCVCFMGGDAEPKQVELLANFVHSKGLLTAWYSGQSQIPKVNIMVFDYIKIGPYIESLGALKSSTTNQRFYHITSNGQLEDQTYLFQQKH